MPTPRSQHGFTMALALAMIVVMGVMLLKIGPLVSAEVQRENEAELIFRGEAVATALRVYFAKNGRYPTDLEEVMKVRPRILRQKYKDPMTAAGDWEFITQVQPGASGNTEGLPIVGVRSRSIKDSFRIYQNKELYHDWLFTADQNLLGFGPGGATGAASGAGSSDDRSKTGTKPGATPGTPASPKL